MPKINKAMGESLIAWTVGLVLLIIVIGFYLARIFNWYR